MLVSNHNDAPVAFCHRATRYSMYQNRIIVKYFKLSSLVQRGDNVQFKS